MTSTQSITVKSEPVTNTNNNNINDINAGYNGTSLSNAADSLMSLPRSYSTQTNTTNVPILQSPSQSIFTTTTASLFSPNYKAINGIGGNNNITAPLTRSTLPLNIPLTASNNNNNNNSTHTILNTLTQNTTIPSTYINSLYQSHNNNSNNTLITNSNANHTNTNTTPYLSGINNAINQANTMSTADITSINTQQQQQQNTTTGSTNTGSSTASSHGRIKTACAPCYIAKTSCTGTRPCQRCMRLDRTVDCVDRPSFIKRPRQPKPLDGQPAKRGRKPKPRDAQGNIIHDSNQTKGLSVTLLPQIRLLNQQQQLQQQHALQQQSVNNTATMFPVNVPNIGSITTNNNVSDNINDLSNATHVNTLNNHNNNTTGNSITNSHTTTHNNATHDHTSTSAHSPADSHDVMNDTNDNDISHDEYSDTDSDISSDFDAEDKQLSRVLLSIYIKSWPSIESALNKGRFSLSQYEWLCAFQSAGLLPQDQIIYSKQCLSSPSINKSLQRLGSDNWMAKTKFHFSYTHSQNEALSDDPKLPAMAAIMHEPISVTKRPIQRLDNIANHHNNNNTNNNNTSTQQHNSTGTDTNTDNGTDSTNTNNINNVITSESQDNIPSSHSSPSVSPYSVVSDDSIDSWYEWELDVQSSVTVNREFERVFGWSQSEVKAMFSRSGTVSMYKFIIPIKSQVARSHVGTSEFIQYANSRLMIDDNTFRYELDRIQSFNLRCVFSGQNTTDVIINTKWNQRIPCLITSRIIQSKENTFSLFSSSFLPIPKKLLEERGCNVSQHNHNHTHNKQEHES